MSRPETEPELRLLLDDYGSRARQWLTRFASLSPHDRKPAAPANGGPKRHLHLLIGDYPRHQDEWWKSFREAGPTAAKPQPADQADLSLLIEDYQPARQALAFLGRKPAQRLSQVSEPTARRPIPADEPALNLEVPWDEDLSLTGRRKPLGLSLIVHAFLVVFLILQPRVLPFNTRPMDLEVPNFTLLLPPEDFLLELTQPEPNEGDVSIEFEGRDEPPVPVMEPPEVIAPVPPNPQPEPKADPEPPKSQAESPDETAPEPPPERRVPDPDPEPAPPLIAARSPNPGELRIDQRLGRPSELPMPKSPARPNERPKLRLEEVRTGSPGRAGPVQPGSIAFNARPGQIVQGAIANLARGRGAKQAVGDGFGAGGLSGYLPPSPGNSGSNLELLSDPMGVDFRPYLLQVLSTVRRNWYAVIPESARLGMNRGAVAIQLRIVRDGNVAKLVIASSSGTSALDRAAVAGISASNPLPPLPPDFKGDRVNLQFVFRYNLRR